MDTPDLLVGLFAAGMGLSFFGTDPKSPTSRALAFFLVAVGVTFCLNVPVNAGLFGSDPWVWGRLFTLGETAIFVSAYEWLLRIRRTEAAADGHNARHERLLRISQGLAALYGLLGILFNHLMREAFKGDELSRPGYYLFAVPTCRWDSPSSRLGSSCAPTPIIPNACGSRLSAPPRPS